VKQLVALTVNGEEYQVAVRPTDTLLKVLREDLLLTGTKEGCDLGECGACTVLVDGLAVNACLLLAIDLQGRAVTTIEGLQDPDGGLTPLQEAFVENGAIHCGFCTPGMVVTAHDYLEHTPVPDRQALLRAIEGNVCRCTGYVKVVAAIEAAQRAALVVVDADAADETAATDVADSGLPETLRFTLNGAEVEVGGDGNRTLLSVLREDFGLLGVKEGCSKGHCGSCSVLVDGEVALSCHTPAGEVAGRSVVTIEGIGTREEPHPLQRAFVELGAVQCGFCTPGVIVAAKGLLDRNHDPSRGQIMAALNRNLCRCTGYVKLVEAVQLAAAYLRGDEGSPAAASAQSSSSGERLAVGRSYPRRDAWDKVLGTARYAADLSLAGMLHGVAVRSPHAHALLGAIRVDAALEVPGVVAVLTAKDVPGRNGVAIFRPDQPVLAEGKVRHIGETVALVVAETVDAARTARDLVEVAYEPLPVLSTVEEALAEDAPRVHDDVPNEVFSRRLARGDAAGAMAQADVVVGGRFTTPYNEHVYMEPEAGLASMDGDQVVVRVGTQNAQHCRTEIAKVLAIEPERVRVLQTTTGGGFGGRLDVPFPALLAVAAYATKRPVRIVLTREESFLASTKRHPFDMTFTLGARRSGEIVALQADLTANTGAYLSFGMGVTTRAVVHASGPYRIPNIEVVGRAVHTNGPTSGAMRGFGTPQVMFALESLVDELCLRLDLDPVEVRRVNGYRDGDCTASGQPLDIPVAYLPTLDVLEVKYRAARTAADAFNASAKAAERRVRRGVGIASMWFGPGKTSLAEKSYAFVEMQPSGAVRLVTTAADIGQGLDTVMAQVVAEELRMPYEAIEVSTRDTEDSPDGGFTCASRQTYNTGNAAVAASRRLKESVAAAAAEMLGVAVDRVTIVGGEARVRGESSVRLSFADLVKAGHPRRYFGAYAADVGDLDVDGQGRPYETYTFGTQVVEVEVHVDTGQVKVLTVYVSHDVGTMINPQAVEGQIEGGVLMGIGFALKEDFVPGRTENLVGYRIPRFKDMPEIDTLPLEYPHPFGPFGATGAGECAQMPTAPAITNAIFDAVRVRVTSLPATPARMRELLADRRTADRATIVANPSPAAEDSFGG
jgi:aldehyde oxidoreductase